MNIFTDCNDCEFYFVCSENMPNKLCEEIKREIKKGENKNETNRR